jgi:exodeoxyribonuclease VIII
MTAQEYFAHPGVSKSSLDDFARCPAYYHAAHIARTVKRETTPAMQFGSLLHGLVLEGRADYHTKPDGMTFASKDGKAWKEAHQDKPILSADTAAELQAMASAILRHPHAAPLFGKGQAELAMFGTHKETGLAIKGRADWVGLADFGKHRLVDIKTTADASNAAFSRSIATYRYHVQAAMYCELAKQNGYQVDDFYFIAIEKGDVPLINVRVLSQAAIELGKITLDAQLRDLKACSESDFWPDYSGADNGPGVIDLPPWSYTDTTGCELTGVDEVTTESPTLELTPGN